MKRLSFEFVLEIEQSEMDGLIEHTEVAREDEIPKAERGLHALMELMMVHIMVNLPVKRMVSVNTIPALTPLRIAPPRVN